MSIPSSTPTPTVTPTATAVTSTATPTATTTPTRVSTSPDYEPDDTCQQANPIGTDGVVQARAFETVQDLDWVYFDAVAGAEYLIEAQVPLDSLADIHLSLYTDCNSTPDASQDYFFSPTVRMSFKAPSTERIYLRVRNASTAGSGAQAYQLSVNNMAGANAKSVVIIVAGKYKENDRLQSNIYNVTDAVYRLFEERGYSADEIMYIAPDTSRPGVDLPATAEDVRLSITDWAVRQGVGPNRALTLFMMDHGDHDIFYLDEPRGERITPAQLDSWLTQLESARPGTPINVIYEACYSGSFIDAASRIGKPNRVIITSAASDELAKASSGGALFSDHLISSLRRGSSLYNSFLEAEWAVRSASRVMVQTPWLDSNGDGIPNSAEDGLEAARRGFGFPGTFSGERWPPYIAQVTTPAAIQNGRGLITAQVLVNPKEDKVDRVWAVVYPPSYQPPTTGIEMVEPPTTIPLVERGADLYGIDYPSFDEVGTYRVIIYARSDKGSLARPVTVEVTTGYQIFLPALTR